MVVVVVVVIVIPPVTLLLDGEIGYSKRSLFKDVKTANKNKTIAS